MCPAAAGLSATGLQIALHATRSPITLGASYARRKENAKAIECYEKAASAYCALYNTSEKSVKAGDFRDENLGATLYRLGRLYAAEGKVQKTESRCALAAKCGYQPAIDFCKEYRIKY